MNKEIITFDDIEIGKHKFYHDKNPILMHDADIDIRVRLGIMLQKMSRCVNILMKVNICLYWWWFVKNIIKPGIKPRKVLKKDFLANQFTMKNISKLK